MNPKVQIIYTGILVPHSLAKRIPPKCPILWYTPLIVPFKIPLIWILPMGIFEFWVFEALPPKWPILRYTDFCRGIQGLWGLFSAETILPPPNVFFCIFGSGGRLCHCSAGQSPAPQNVIVCESGVDYVTIAKFKYFWEHRESISSPICEGGVRRPHISQECIILHLAFLLSSSIQGGEVADGAAFTFLYFFVAQ